MEKLTTIQKDLLLELIKHHMDLDLRKKISREMPQAYNAWMGAEYFKVVKNEP